MFCHAFKDFDGSPMNTSKQMDIDEFFNNLMDRIEDAIKPTPQSKIIQRVFGGSLSNELIFKGCPHYSEREEPFMALSLPVKNKKSVKESL
jgi:ubiquitin carboxyl-terminal hydrolase 9/24